MHAIRARHAFDGERFLPGGATVLVEGTAIAGVEPFGYDVPAGCPTTTHEGTLLPELAETHAHLVTDSGPLALTRVELLGGGDRRGRHRGAGPAARVGG